MPIIEQEWTEEDFLALFFSLPDEERAMISKFLTIHTKVEVNLEFAKTMINQMEGCRVCGSTYDQIQRNKHASSK